MSGVDRVDPETWVPLAEIARPHGVRGEVRLRLFNKESDALLDQDEVLVRLPDGEEHEVSVDGARRADDAILLKLFSVDDRDRADELRGALVCIRRKDFAAAEDGEFYAVDVIGCEVRLEGARIGAITELVTYPSVQALRVKADDGLGDWEIPLTGAFVENVDVKGRLVTLVTLEGVDRDAPKKKRVPRSRGAMAAKGAKNAASAADAKKKTEG